ncbi:MAG: hypothetical protein J1F40_00925 [Prevotellaceae bacterium]|nr:hypothetical protein [Prevotellaceae bacterium]
MKKIFYLATLLFCATIISCSTETDVPAGGTAVKDMAGVWDVQVDLMELDENGDTIHYGDYYGYGTFQFYTYNTAENTSNTIWVDDLQNFWWVKAAVNCNLSTLTFSGNDVLNVYDGEETCKVTGKVFPNGATNLHGMPNDSICIDFEFDTDPGVIYRYAGQRYTGFYE